VEFDRTVDRKVEYICDRILVVQVLPGVQRSERKQSGFSFGKRAPPGNCGEFAYLTLSNVLAKRLLGGQNNRIGAEKTGAWNRIGSRSICIAQSQKTEALSCGCKRCRKTGAI